MSLPRFASRSVQIIFVVALGASLQVEAATLVVANKAEATVSLIDLDTGDVVATLPTGDGPHEVGISPDGSLALVTDYGRNGVTGNSLTLIDIPGMRVVRTIDLGEYRAPHGVEWLDDRRAAVTVEDNKALIVVDVDSGKVERSIDTGQRTTHMVALHPDGRRAYTANIGSGSVTAIDLEGGTRIQNVATGDGAEGIAVTPDGEHIWVTNRGADTVIILDAGTLEPVAEFPSVGFPIRATATAAGQVLVTRARAGQLAIYDAETFDEIRVIAFDLGAMDVDERLFGDRFGDSSVPIGVIVDDLGRRGWVAHANADVITEIDLGSGEIVRILEAGREPDGMGYSSLAVSR